MVAQFASDTLDVVSDSYVVDFTSDLGVNTLTGILYRAPSSNDTLPVDSEERLFGFVVYDDPTALETFFGTEQAAPTGLKGDLSAPISFHSVSGPLKREELLALTPTLLGRSYQPVLRELAGTTIERDLTPGSESIRVRDGDPDRFGFFHPEIGTLEISCGLQVDPASPGDRFAVTTPDRVAGTNFFTLDTVADALSGDPALLATAGIDAGEVLPLICSVREPGGNNTDESFDGPVLNITYDCTGAACIP